MSEEVPKKRFFQFKRKITNNLSEESTEPFDESSFSFELKSNGLNTSLIEASATQKKGKNIGAPLPLSCTWYRATDEKGFVPIEGVTGAFYQPNADDIGCKICVHAVPVSEAEEYNGMPAFSEIGPIQIDPEIQSAVQDLLAKNSANFNVQIIGDKTTQTRPGVIQIQNDMISVTNNEGKNIISAKLEENSPKIWIIYKTHNSFFMSFEEKKIEINAEKAIQRDIIVICIRMFCSKVQCSGLSEILLKNQQLSNRLFDLNKNHEQSLIVINNLKEELTVKSEDLNYYIKNCKNFEKEYSELKQSHEKLLASEENLNRETVFLRKDLLVYKEQCSDLEKKIESETEASKQSKSQIDCIKEELESLTKIIGCGICKVDERLYIILDKITGNTTRMHSSRASSILSMQEDTFDGSDKEKYQEVDHYLSQIKHLQDEISEVKDKAEAEKNFYKKKAESLSAENERLLSRLGKNPKDLSEFAIEKIQYEESKVGLQKKLEEANEKIANYEKIMKINKRKLDMEIEKGFELRKLVRNKTNNSNTDYQRIVNSLTQTLSEREEELAKQKSLNKDFMRRIEELERSNSEKQKN